MTRPSASLGERGFTLLEALLSVTIIGLLVGASMPIYQSFQSRTDLDVTTESVAGMLRRAQTYSRGSKDNSVWSVQFAANGVTLFKGAIYASRDTAYDESTAIGTSTTLSWTGTISFAKLTGTPSTTGNVVITNPNNETRTVTLNGEGMVDY